MKLADLVIEMGKVQTDRDNPPFKTPKQIEKEGKITNPMTPHTDFSKPTLVNLSKKEYVSRSLSDLPPPSELNTQ